MDSKEAFEQYRSAGHRQRFNYESHSGAAVHKVHDFDARNWLRIAAYWYLVKAGVVMNIPKGIHLKLLSKQVRRECDAIHVRYAMDLQAAKDKADQHAAVDTFIKMGCRDANLQAS